MTLSLYNRRVLVPRGRMNSSSFSKIVKEFQGIPIEVPLLDFRPVLDKEEVEKAFSNLHTYDWIIFTSEVTVSTFFSFFIDRHNIVMPKIAAIGQKTKEELTKRGYHVQFVPEKYVAESFVEEFLPYLQKGEKILLPKGNLAREFIPQYLANHEIIVDTMIIYETFFPEESKNSLKQLLESRSFDVLPFTSPSTIDHFMSVVKEFDLFDRLENCIIAVIGPVSKKKCEEVGLKVDVMPEKYTSYEMLKAVALYLSEVSS